MKRAFVLTFAFTVAALTANTAGAGNLDSLRHKATLQPNNPEVHIALGKAYLAADEQGRAILELERALQLDSSRTEARKLLARLYSWNGMPAKAAAQYQALLREAPGDTALMRTLAEHYIWANKPEKAIPLLQQLVRLRPNDRKLRLTLAQQCLWNAKAACAVEVFAALVRSNPKDTLAVHGLVQSLFAAGQSQKALKVYAYLLHLAPQRLDWWLDYAQQCSWNNRWSEAIEAYRHVLTQDPENTVAWRGLVDVLMWSGRQQEAAEVLRRWLSAHPDDVKARWKLVQILNWSGAPANALWEQLTALLQRAPEHLNARELLLDQFGFPGREWSTKWQQMHDSNDLTIATTTAEVSVPWKSNWEFAARGWHRNFVERRPDTSATVWGTGGELAVRRGLHFATWFSGSIEGTSYANHWVPTGYSVGLDHRFGYPLVAAVRVWQHESREGAFAVRENISASGWQVRLIHAPSSRLQLRALADLVDFSDGNRKVDWFVSGSYRIRMSRPGVIVEGYVGYEDFRTVYPNSIPYWTPDNLVHQSLGVSLDHAFSDRLVVGAGYSLARNPGYPLSSNFRASFSFQITSGLSLMAEYYDFGSAVYHSSTVLLRVYGGF